MEIGEEHLALLDPGPLRLDRLLHLEDQLGLGPDVVHLGDKRRADARVRGVGEARSEARALLHQDGVAVRRQRFRARGHQSYAVLRRLDLSRYADDHRRSVWVPYVWGPSQTTVWRAGSKNSAATCPTSSGVRRSTIASKSSRLR